uniref:Uncharacterized protein n=1 Tax=viral metagenome TaxID=1070528 RepID=A0A6M3JQK1_9ZZZZ
MTYYKVVKEQYTCAGKVLVSAWTSQRLDQDDILCVQYSLGEWTYPKLKGSKLFVCDNYKGAVEFCDMVYADSIYECEVRRPQKTGPFHSLINKRYDTIIEMWRLYKNKKKYRHLTYDRPVVRTVWVDAVKLTKRINWR